MRTYSLVDKLIVRLDKLLEALSQSSSLSDVGSLEPSEPLEVLSTPEQKHSIALMRINHSGEVCAQALYLGQALVARHQELANQLYQASQEEKDHLAWCARRLQELGGHRSWLNPVWAVGSFGIGVLAGACGDKVSLGFLAETEEQVTRHLENHLNQLSPFDKRSRAILLKMQEDEKKHATQALASGGISLPRPIRALMAFCSKIMTTTAAYL